jgi:hypothetical protein
MMFFSGFSLKNEAYLFDEYIKKSEYSVCGFSYGAIAALRMTIEMLNAGKRVDALQLFSPAFFQTKDEKFKRVQMLTHSKNRLEYMKHFIDSCFYPYEKKIVEFKKTTRDELSELLNYKYNIEDLKKIEESGVKIEVYLGGEDMIIDVQGAKDFFIEIATVSYIKSANHFLQTN